MALIRAGQISDIKLNQNPQHYPPTNNPPPSKKTKQATDTPDKAAALPSAALLTIEELMGGDDDKRDRNNMRNNAGAASSAANQQKLQASGSAAAAPNSSDHSNKGKPGGIEMDTTGLGNMRNNTGAASSSINQENETAAESPAVHLLPPAERCTRETVLALVDNAARRLPNAAPFFVRALAIAQHMGASFSTGESLTSQDFAMCAALSSMELSWRLTEVGLFKRVGNSWEFVGPASAMERKNFTEKMPDAATPLEFLIASLYSANADEWNEEAAEAVAKYIENLGGRIKRDAPEADRMALIREEMDKGDAILAMKNRKYLGGFSKVYRLSSFFRFFRS